MGALKPGNMIRIHIVSSGVLYTDTATCYSITDDEAFSASNHSNAYFVLGNSEIKLKV